MENKMVLCVCKTIFGDPVEPEVARMHATSSDLDSAAFISKIQLTRNPSILQRFVLRALKLLLSMCFLLCWTTTLLKS